MNNGMITARLASCIFLYVDCIPLGKPKNTNEINLNE